MNRASLSILVPVAIATCAVPADGAIVFISATRSVSATASNFQAPADTVRDAVTGLDPFDHVVQRQVQSYQEPAGVLQQGYAEQHSRFDGNVVAFSGVVSGTDNVLVMGTGTGCGESTLTLNFALSDPTAWTCAFNDSVAPTNMSQAWMAVQDSSNATIALINEQLPSSPRSGLLMPGAYRLTLYTTDGWSGVGAGSGSATYDWTFAFDVPSPAGGVFLALAPFCIGRRRAQANSRYTGL